MWSIPLKSVARIELLLVTRAPVLLRVISLTVISWVAELTSDEPGYNWPPFQSPLGSMLVFGLL